MITVGTIYICRVNGSAAFWAPLLLVGGCLWRVALCSGTHASQGAMTSVTACVLFGNTYMDLLFVVYGMQNAARVTFLATRTVTFFVALSRWPRLLFQIYD